MYLADYEDPQMHGLFSSLKKVIKKVVKPVAHIGAAVVTGGASIPLSSQLIMRSKANAAQQKQNAAEAAEFDRQSAILGGWTTLTTEEGQSFTVPPNTTVRYGADSRWKTQVMSGTATQSPATFGGDPAFGTRKTVQAQLSAQAAIPAAAQATPMIPATPAAPVMPVATIAPTANAVQAAVSQAQPAMPNFYTVPSGPPAYDMPFDTRSSAQPVQRQSSGVPSWAVPAGIGAAVLIGLMAMGGRGKR